MAEGGTAGRPSSALRRVLVPLALAQFICSFAGTILVAGITKTPERSYGLAMITLAAVGVLGLLASALLPRTPAPADVPASRP